MTNNSEGIEISNAAPQTLFNRPPSPPLTPHPSDTEYDHELTKPKPLGTGNNNSNQRKEPDKGAETLRRLRALRERAKPASSAPQTSPSPASSAPQTPPTQASSALQNPLTPASSAPQTPSTPASSARQTPPTPASSAPQNPPTQASSAPQNPPTPASRAPQNPPTPASRARQTPPTQASSARQNPLTPTSRAPQNPLTPASSARQTPSTPDYNTITESAPQKTLLNKIWSKIKKLGGFLKKCFSSDENSVSDPSSSIFVEEHSYPPLPKSKKKPTEPTPTDSQVEKLRNQGKTVKSGDVVVSKSGGGGLNFTVHGRRYTPQQIRTLVNKYDNSR